MRWRLTDSRIYRTIGFVVVAVFAVLAPRAILALQTQTAAPTPNQSFDVASVKRSDPGATGGVISGPTPGQFTVRNMSLDRIIVYGYGIRDYQLTGGPSWIHSDRFDIVAKYPQGWPDQGPSLNVMVRTLLADRFKLKMHSEPREGQTYALVTARDDRRLGPKLRPSSVDCEAFLASQAGRGRGTAPVTGTAPTCMALSMGNAIHGNTRTLAMLASALASRVGRPVVDRSGLTGNFDFDLEWSPVLVAPSADAAPTLDDQTSIFTALQEQLGLKLQQERGPIDTWIVDGVERPLPD